MNLPAKQLAVTVLSLFFLGSLLIVGYIESERFIPEKKPKPVLAKKDLSCINCHAEKSPAVVTQWKESRHASLGVGCMDCHEAKKDDPDVWEHEESFIAAIPSPKDCARCHEKQAEEFTASAHSRAAENVPPLDSFRGKLASGDSEAIGGCQKCHGNVVKILGDGTPDRTTWPNTGVGRTNPDGSKGSCNVCHTRHQFASSQARRPESCGKCHIGPEHPQIEIYGESKHGLLVRARIGEMNLTSLEWIAGKNYSAAPTCATCHMSATKTLPITHDVGERLARAFSPIVSKKRENEERKRKNMLSACNACHGSEYTKAYFAQSDEILDRYNDKFAAPAEAIMELLKGEGKLTPDPFDQEIEWVFFELWHHGGRRAEEIARLFKYTFLPEAERLSPGIAGRFVKDP
ncbi:MAG: multiheme c-type cytochrome [Nitrospinota bacterium]